LGEADDLVFAGDDLRHPDRGLVGLASRAENSERSSAPGVISASFSASSTTGRESMPLKR